MEDQLLEAQERLHSLQQNYKMKLAVGSLLRQNSHVYLHNNPISLNQKNLIPLVAIKVQNEKLTCGYIQWNITYINHKMSGLISLSLT